MSPQISRWLSFAMSWWPVLLLIGQPAATMAAVLDKQAMLDAQTFWDNRDWDWYKANIPFFDCPDPEITTTWYYRWELVTKHLTYGSPTSGYSFTEFIDRPFWSGAYGAISCPAGHQLYEIRWLHDPRYAQDYSRYWFRTPGAQPRNYSTWLADAVWAVRLVEGDEAFARDLLPDLIRNYEGWEQKHFVPGVGLFWQIGHDDGMEYNINSRQTQDILRGAPGFRPTFNAYMWADALAIAAIAERAGDTATASRFREKAAGLKARLQALLWDPKREFFFHMFRDNEMDKEGNQVQALTLTYQTGKYAGSPHGREEIGFVPWQFNLPDAGYESAWQWLMKPDYFYAPFGPTTVERNDPLFVIQKTCCWWSGMSWPYATTQTLKAMANLLQNYRQQFVSREDYLKLLQVYARTQRKNGRPYIAEAAHPDTGSWEGHDSYNHSEHYFHSGFNDLIITGLIGVKPRADDVFEIDPLAPADWPWFAVDDLLYHGRRVSVVWDKDGKRYHTGPGLHILVDGRKVASAPGLQKLSARIPAGKATRLPEPRANFAVNNEGDYFPRFTASFTGPGTSVAMLNDGNYWYMQRPPNRWTTVGSSNATDWVELDLGTARQLDTFKLYFLDDGTGVVAPSHFVCEYWTGKEWKSLPRQQRTPDSPQGHRPNVVTFKPTRLQKARFTFSHGDNGRTGLTEVEAWGPQDRAYQSPHPPAGNLALNLTGQGFPTSSASFTDRFGGSPRMAQDGKTVYRPTPMNRWTAYGTTNKTDWLEFDFGSQKTFSKVDLCIYDDRGGVQAPEAYSVRVWDGAQWREVPGQVKTPPKPVGGQLNSDEFPEQTATRLRVVFTHRPGSSSGVTEVMVWK